MNNIQFIFQAKLLNPRRVTLKLLGNMNYVNLSLREFRMFKRMYDNGNFSYCYDIIYDNFVASPRKFYKRR